MKKLRVLVGCECSGKVRDAFLARGCDAWSCDLKESDGPHLQADVISAAYSQSWDLFICHPPCTHLSVSGARWLTDPRYPNKLRDQKAAIRFVETLWAAPIPKICFENPVGVLSTQWKEPTQYIDPVQFGHAQTKKTCLWLKNLPLLIPLPAHERPTLEAMQIGSFGHKFARSSERGSARSVTFDNIAFAMAKLWAS